MSTVTQEKTLESEVLRSYRKMFLCGVGTVMAALLVAAILNHYFAFWLIIIKLSEWLGYIGWATTLGTGVVVSWSRNTPAEQLDRRLLKWVTMIGIFAFVLSRELIVASPSFIGYDTEHEFVEKRGRQGKIAVGRAVDHPLLDELGADWAEAGGFGSRDVSNVANTVGTGAEMCHGSEEMFLAEDDFAK